MPKKAKKKTPVGPVREPTEFDNDDILVLTQKKEALQTALKNAVEKRSYYCLERDTVRTFRDRTAKQVEDTHRMIHARERQIEDLMESHRIEIEVYAHKVKHLKYETNVDVTQVRSVTEALLSDSQKKYRHTIETQEEAKIVAQDDLDDQAKLMQESIEHLRAGNQMDIEELQAHHKKAIETYRDTCAERMRELKEKLDVQRRVELQEIEDRKNSHLRTLMSNHEQAFAEMREYYRAITADNLGLIKRYEEDIKDLATNESRNLEHLRSALQKSNDLKGVCNVTITCLDI